MAIAPGAVRSNAYSTILARLADQNYTHSTNPTRFYRQVAGIDDPVKVDLISGEYLESGKAQSVRINELALSSLRGIDLAFENCEEITLEGAMPGGAHNRMRARIVRPEAFVLIKAFALAERGKAKDAYDVAFVLHHYQPSIARLAEKLAPLVAHGLGREAYAILEEKFATFESVGPTWAAEVAAENGEDTPQARQAAFQDAAELFARVRAI